MANTYSVISSEYFPNPAGDPPVTIVGTVNGVPVTVQIPLSVLANAQLAGGITAVKNVVAPVMLAAVPVTPVLPTQLPTGTFTQ